MDNYYIYLQFLSIFATFTLVDSVIDKAKAKSRQGMFRLLIYFFIIGLAISYPYFNLYKWQYFLLAGCYPLMAFLAIYKKRKISTLR